jgi:hypothetical protein
MCVHTGRVCEYTGCMSKIQMETYPKPPNNIYLINTKNQQKYFLLYVLPLKKSKTNPTKQTPHLLIFVPLEIKNSSSPIISTISVIRHPLLY